MRISDWSSDVCSSDLRAPRLSWDCCMAVYSVCYRCFLAFCSQPCWVGVDSSGVTPNNSFNPNPLRSTNNMAGRACHVVSSTTQVGLTQALYVRSEEHTSELQSLMRISYAVFCLKKKRKNTQK